MINYMIDYMMERGSAYLIFMVLWVVFFLITMNVMEWIDKKRKKRK